MLHRDLNRNVRARDLLETLLISAVTSLLLVRLYLYLTGFPQIGGGGLHIAHMLWGGVLMLAGLVITLSFLGHKAQRLAAIIGGAGFGVFIDEIGKFVTHDNNYFYRPSIGIIYAIFLILYLLFNFISRDLKLTSREYQLNALSQFEEALAHDMDTKEKSHAKALLAKADQNNHITKEMQRLLDGIRPVANTPEGKFRRAIFALDKLYKIFWNRRGSNRFVRVFFVAQAVIFFLGVILSFYTNVDDFMTLLNGQIDYGKGLLIGEFASSLIAVLFALRGAFLLKYTRLQAFEQFRRAVLINLFLTDFFTFTRIEFGALPGFFLNLSLLIIINYVMRQELRSKHTS